MTLPDPTESALLAALTADSPGLTALDWLSVACLAAAVIPALATLVNLRLFRPPPPAAPNRRPISVLVPARDEEASIERTLRSILASDRVDLEVLVLDDGSTDATAAVVERIASADPRLRLLRGAALPPGWCGKQHACWQLAAAASRETIAFVDADVALAPDALARAAAFLDLSGADLVSGFPRQATSTFVDWLLLPLIHFVLLGFLPLGRSRRSRSPSLAAGCGQLFVTTQTAYRRAGGHAAIRESLHDGVKLPRSYRAAGLATDLFDASSIATCRMYARSLDVLRGLSKNATEGLAAPRLVVPASILLSLGQIAPPVLVAIGWLSGWKGFGRVGIAAAIAAVAACYLPRLAEAIRFRGSLAAAALHPLAVALFLGIQWYGAVRQGLGLKTRWKGRPLAPQT
jgi:hypothetical protein